SRRRHTSFSRDWSSDVCSSDLDIALAVELPVTVGKALPRGAAGSCLAVDFVETVARDLDPFDAVRRQAALGVQALEQDEPFLERSEERRVGKGGRCRGSTHG